MNWEMIGAVGELLGAVVVVGSIVYLASQVRHNTAVARSDVGRELAASYNDWTFGIATDERLPALWVMNVYERISRADVPPADAYRLSMGLPFVVGVGQGTEPVPLLHRQVGRRSRGAVIANCAKD